MKKTIILLTLVGLNALSASAMNSKKLDTPKVVDILIKHDFIVERKVRQSREIRPERAVRKSREARQNRMVRMGRNSRGIRPERITRLIYTMPQKKHYLSQLTK